MRRSVTRGPPLTDRRRSYHSLRGRQLSLIGSARLSPPACSVTDRFGKVRGLFNVWFFNPERQLSSNRNVSGGSKRPIRRYARSRPKPAGHDCGETFQLAATPSGRGERPRRTEARTPARAGILPSGEHLLGLSPQLRSLRYGNEPVLEAGSSIECATGNGAVVCDAQRIGSALQRTDEQARIRY